jgi:hypothetical protein
MNKLININTSTPDLLQVYTTERQGGIDVWLSIDDRVKDILAWVQQHRQQLE